MPLYWKCQSALFCLSWFPKGQSWYHCRQCDTRPQASSGQYFRLLLLSGPAMPSSLHETQASLGILHFVISQYLLKLTSIESVMPSNHLNLCHPLLLLPSILPSIRVFPVSQLFASGGQSIGASASASVLPMNVQGWFPLGLTSLIILLSKGLSRAFYNTAVLKYQFFGTQPSLWSSSHIHTRLLGKT